MAHTPDIDLTFGLHKQLIVSCEGPDFPDPTSLVKSALGTRLSRTLTGTFHFLSEFPPPGGLADSCYVTFLLGPFEKNNFPRKLVSPRNEGVPRILIHKVGGQFVSYWNIIGSAFDT